MGWAPLPEAQWLLLAGDETTLPLIKTVLARPPDVPRLVVVVEIHDGAERQPLELPGGGEVAWAAGESIVVKGVREHLKQDRGMPRGSVRAIGWWLHRSNPEYAEIDEE